MSEKVKKSPGALSPGKGHALCLPVAAATSPVCFVRELTCSGEESGPDLAAGNVGTRGIDKGVAVGVVALELPEEGAHTYLMTLIHRNVPGGGL